MADSKIVKPSETKNVSELFLNSAFKINIPRYQREYVWIEEQWSDLLEDILNKNLEEIFLGFILVHYGKDGENLNVYHIVDGQQRIVTLSIVFAALARLEESLKKADEAYIRKEVFNQSIKGVSFNKISANIGKDFLDNLFYKTIEPGKPTLKAEKLLFDCYTFFYEELKKVATSSSEIDSLFDRINNAITFSVTSTDSYEKAIRLFQVLNDNSIKLSATDLFKNFLLSGLDSRPDSELDEYAERWNEVSDLCSEGKLHIQDYLHRLAMSRVGYFKGTELFSYLKGIFENTFSNNPIEFMDYIEADVDRYRQIFTHDTYFIERGAFDEIRTLLKVFNSLKVNEPITFFYSILSTLLISEIQSKNRVIRLLFKKYLHFTIVRYKLNGSGRAYMHKVYPLWALSLREFSVSPSSTIQDLLNNAELKKVDILNEKYFSINAVSNSSIVETEIEGLTFSSNKKNKKINKNDSLIKYLLCLYYFDGDEKMLNTSFDKYSIEHIANDSDVSFGSKRYSFGNLMLVLNDSWGNADFQTKLSYFEKEAHVVKVKDIVLTKNSWEPSNVDERGKIMSKKIAKLLK